MKCNLPSSVAKRMLASELISEMDMLRGGRGYVQLVVKVGWVKCLSIENSAASLNIVLGAVDPSRQR